MALLTCPVRWHQKSSYLIKESRVSYSIYIGFLEIYNEELKDLLVPPKKLNTPTQLLKIREDPQTGVFIEGLTLKKIFNLEDLNKLIYKGVKHRTTSKTKLVLA